jgi:hypothetical protein
VRDFARENWKIAAAFAAGAFLLSLLVGLVTRNPFGVVILRAFLLAAFFAGLGIGLRYVVRTYLPEIAAPQAAPAGGEPARDETRGSRIDIVLPEERPPGGQPYTAVSREPGRKAPGGAATPPETVSQEAEPAYFSDAGLGEDSLAHAEARALGELADELAEELPAAAENGEPGESENADEMSGVQTPKEMRGGPTPKQKHGAQAPAARAGSGEEGSLDSLPDISNLEIAADQGSSALDDRSSSRRRGETPEDAIRGVVSGQDPVTLAKAIRTVLKRDEKG